MLLSRFDEWVKRDVGEYYVQIFDATLAQWCGVNPGLCSVNAVCLKAFFEHVSPAMDAMRDLLAQNRAPAEIMEM